MDIIEIARTVYDDTEEVAGWCDINTYQGAETKTHLLGMYKTLQEMADEIERLRESSRAANTYYTEEIERLREILLNIKQESNEDHIRAWAHGAIRGEPNEL